MVLTSYLCGSQVFLKSISIALKFVMRLRRNRLDVVLEHSYGRLASALFLFPVHQLRNIQHILSPIISLSLQSQILSPIQRPLLFRIVRITNSVSRRIELTHSLHLVSRVYLTYIFRCGQLSHSWFGKGASPVSAINVICFEWERDGSYIGSSECFVCHPKWNDEFSRIEQAEQANKPPENALTSWYRNVDETGCVLGICNWSEKYDFDFIQVCF